MTTAEILRRAAEAYRNGDIQWGKGYFFDPIAGCHCAAGAVSYAVDPSDVDCDPQWSADSETALSAIDQLADYLVHELGWPAADDPIEVIADWNDNAARTPDEVIAALEAASERAA